jgi:hypothetical protein
MQAGANESRVSKGPPASHSVWLPDEGIEVDSYCRPSSISIILRIKSIILILLILSALVTVATTKITFKFFL